MAVANYIMARGVVNERITIEYKGESRPVAPNENPDRSDNPEGRRLNRRAEVIIKIGISK